MNYRNLDKNIFLKLNHNQAYVAACFSFKSDFVTGESHIHQDTLADYCQCSPSKIQDYISVFKKVGFIRSCMTRYFKNEDGLPRRQNEYLLNVPDSNYFTIRKELLEKDIPVGVIGYVLLLKCLCLNGTNTCFYNLLEISNKLKVGYSTLKGKNGLHQKAIDYGLITDDKVRYEGKSTIRHTIMDSNILLGDGLDIPDLNAEEHGIYVEQYDIIRSCCLDHDIYPPRYDEQVIRKIMNHFVDDNLKNALNRRLDKVKEDHIYSLNYIAKMLNIQMDSPSKEEYTFVMP